MNLSHATWALPCCWQTTHASLARPAPSCCIPPYTTIRSLTLAIDPVLPADPAAEQPPHFGPFKERARNLPVLRLRVEQQRSLHWMLSQESDDSVRSTKESSPRKSLFFLALRSHAS